MGDRMKVEKVINNNLVRSHNQKNQEVLIHIGLDTVKLNGKYFTARAKSGDRVEIGTPLVDVDIEKVKEAGYDVITPVIISNTFEYGDVLGVEEQNVKAGDNLIKAVK